MDSAAFTYPTNREDWLKTIIIGGVLSFLGFLLVPLFLVYGYVVRSIQTSIARDPTPPAFEDWGSLLVDGLQAVVIGIVYLLIPGIVAILTIGGSVAAMATGTRAGAAAGLAGLLSGMLLSGLLALVFGYFGVAAILNFAHEDRFGAAFEISGLKDIVVSADYAVAWLVSVGVFIISGGIAGIPLIGFFLGPFVGFYAAVVAARLWADGFVEAKGLATQGPSPDAN